MTTIAPKVKHPPLVIPKARSAIRTHCESTTADEWVPALRFAAAGMTTGAIRTYPSRPLKNLRQPFQGRSKRTGVG